MPYYDHILYLVFGLDHWTKRPRETPPWLQR